jgi:hypothetical protein
LAAGADDLPYRSGHQLNLVYWPWTHDHGHGDGECVASLEMNPRILRELRRAVPVLGAFLCAAVNTATEAAISGAMVVTIPPKNAENIRFAATLYGIPAERLAQRLADETGQAEKMTWMDMGAEFLFETAEVIQEEIADEKSCAIGTWPGRETVPVVLHTPGRKDETLHVSANIWHAYAARCEAAGKDPGAVLETLVREHAEACGLIAPKGKGARK